MAVDSSLQTIYSSMSSTATPVLLSSGAWHSFNATESILIMYAGRIVSGDYSRFALGDINSLLGANGKGFGLSDGTFHTALGIDNTAVGRAFKSSPIASVASITNVVPFTSRPALAFVDPSSSGAGAAATAVMSDDVGGTGTLVGATFSNHGSGYNTGGGTISVSGGGGTASATWVGTQTKIGLTYNGQDVIVAAKYTPGVSLNYTCYNATTGATLVTTDALNINSYYTNNVGAFTPDACMRIYGVKFYGAGVLTFQNGFPSWIDQDILLMGNMWKNGNRSISPRLIGVS